METFGLTTGTFKMSQKALELRDEINEGLEINYGLENIEGLPPTVFHCKWLPSHSAFLTQVIYDVMPPGSRFRVSKSPYKVTKGHAFITDEAVNIVAPIRGGWTAVLVYPEHGDPATPTLMGYQSNYGLLLVGPYKIKPLQRDLDFTLARVWRSEKSENSEPDGLANQAAGLSV